MTYFTYAQMFFMAAFLLTTPLVLLVRGHKHREAILVLVFAALVVSVKWAFPEILVLQQMDVALDYATESEDAFGGAGALMGGMMGAAFVNQMTHGYGVLGFAMCSLALVWSLVPFAEEKATAPQAAPVQLPKAEPVVGTPVDDIGEEFDEFLNSEPPRRRINRQEVQQVRAAKARGMTPFQIASAMNIHADLVSKALA